MYNKLEKFVCTFQRELWRLDAIRRMKHVQLSFECDIERTTERRETVHVKME